MVATSIDHYSTQSQLVANARAGGRGDTLIEHQDSGKLRIFYFNYTAPASGNPAAGEVLSMGFLPQGRIIPGLTCLHSTDFGSNGTIDVGFNEYNKNDGTVVAADPDELWDGLDVSGQDVETRLSETGVTAVKYGGFQLEGFAELIVTFNTAGMQAAAELHIFVAMVNGQ